MKISEIVAKKDKDLETELRLLSDKLVRTKFEVAAKETGAHTEIRKVKRDIARIKTILRERAIEREEQNEKNI